MTDETALANPDRKPFAMTRPGDLQRRLDAVKDRLAPADYAAAYEEVSFGRLPTRLKMAVLTAEGAVGPPETVDTVDEVDEPEYTERGP